MERMRKRRAKMTDEEKERERANDRARKRKSRALRSFDEDEIERAQSRERKRIKRMRMSEEEKEKERAADRERKRRLRQLEIDRKLINIEMSLLLSTATPEQISIEVSKTMDTMLDFIQIQAENPMIGPDGNLLSSFTYPFSQRKKTRERKVSKEPRERKPQRERTPGTEPKAPRKKMEPKDRLQKKIDKEAAYLARARDRKRLAREQLGLVGLLDEVDEMTLMNSHVLQSGADYDSSTTTLSNNVLQEPAVPAAYNMNYAIHNSMITAAGVSIGTVMTHNAEDVSGGIAVELLATMAGNVAASVDTNDNDGFVGKFYQV